MKKAKQKQPLTELKLSNSPEYQDFEYSRPFMLDRAVAQVERSKHLNSSVLKLIRRLRKVSANLNYLQASQRLVARIRTSPSLA